jgi:exodeoxyribonuclease VII small subunit
MSKKSAPAAEPSFAEHASADASPVADFETSLDALESLVDRMEQGQLSLEDSLAAYERSVGLYRRCQQALEQAELRVRLLSDPERPDSAQAFDDGE